MGWQAEERYTNDAYRESFLGRKGKKSNGFSYSRWLL
jgi:hypothetical protein